MKKVVSILGLCVLFVGSVEGATENQLTVKADVEALLEISGEKDEIDLLGAETARTAIFHTMCNSAAKTRVTLTSKNAAADNGNFNVKSDENLIEYHVNPNGRGDLAKPDSFEIDSKADVVLVFMPLGEKDTYRAGNYTDTVTVTVAPAE